MLQRLQDVKPMYRVSDHVESWRRNAELTEMITAYPEDKKSLTKVQPLQGGILLIIKITFYR